MLNKRIRNLIDELFSDMKMTAENLALRDELMANAQARYDDAVSGGMNEDDAFREVAASLGDVRALLDEMNGAPAADAAEPGANEPEATDAAPETAAETPEAEAAPEAESAPDADGAADAGVSDAQAAPCGTDLGDALNKAFTALGDWGRQLVPQAKKLARQVDEATGGAIDGIGKTVEKGMRDAQRAAEELFAAGRKKEAPAAEAETPERLRAEAEDLRAQAGLKEVSGDQEGARELRAQAYQRETRAEALEQAAAIEQARRDAEQSSGADYASPDGEIDQDAFSKAVEDIVRDADEAAQPSPGQPSSDQSSPGQPSPADALCSGEARFPAAGLRLIDVKVDADDVNVEPAEGAELVVRWDGMREDSVPVARMDGHTLSVRRPNPDVFKTFFSVFSKDGGRITVFVPKGYAADYALSTTSGDIRLTGVDADGVKVNSTSGDVRVEPDNTSRLKELSVTTVSGDVTVSALAGDIAVNTVSGEQFVSCDAGLVDVNAVSGDVHVEGACDELEVSLVSGDATLLCTVAPAKRIRIGSVSASARVALPGDVRGFVAEISGVSGHIENEFGPNRYGTCALPIRMDTMSGCLTITRL